MPWALQQLFHIADSVAMTTLLLALVYKILPDAQVRWGDVWMGAALTAALFTAGKTLLGLYPGFLTVSSVYGAAGSLIMFLLWVYYSAQIFLFGAVFTRVYAVSRS